MALDARVLAVALGTTVASGVAFGLAPLPRRGALQLGSHRAGAAPDDGRGWVRSALVVAQLAVSLILLSGAGLMVRMFAGLQAIPLGFDDRQIVAGELDHPNVYSSVGPATGVLASGRPISPPNRRRADHSLLLQRYRSVVEQVRTIPGVRDVTLASQRPLGTAYILGLEIQDAIGDGWHPVNTLQSLDNVLGVSVLENFFDFFGTRAVAGRLFDAADAQRTEAVVVVDTNAAAKLWPGKAAVGQRIRMLGAEAPVVGVTAPIRYGLAGRTVPTDIPPTIFFLLGRAGPFGGALLIRHERSAAAIMPAIQARVREADSSLQLSGLEPLGTRFDRWVAEPRFQTILLSAFAFLGLVVATLGVYGVVAYAVARRTGEIGVRLALGADRRRIVALFARWNGRLLGTGLGLGLLGSLWLTQYMRALLFGTEPTDPLTFVSVAALLALAALVATLAPMRRALAVDPAVTLRAE